MSKKIELVSRADVFTMIKKYIQRPIIAPRPVQDQIEARNADLLAEMLLDLEIKAYMEVAEGE